MLINKIKNDFEWMADAYIFAIHLKNEVKLHELVKTYLWNPGRLA